MKEIRVTIEKLLAIRKYKLGKAWTWLKILTLGIETAEKQKGENHGL